MPLNKRTGNMFSFVTHTWNPISGICPHNCAYCYMKNMRKQYPKLNEPLHFNRSYLKDNLGENNYIFIGSSTDIFCKQVENDWLLHTFAKAIGYNNKYLLQTKNPIRYLKHLDDFIPSKFVFSTTIETNYFFPKIMNNCPAPYKRIMSMMALPKEYKRMVTIEPIIKFDLTELVAMVLSIHPEQVNIGADSDNNGLPEPTGKETKKLIETLEKYTTVEIKPNLKRILNDK